MQTITFTAASGGELRQQMLDFLGITYSAPVAVLAEVTDTDVVKSVNEIAEPKPDVKIKGEKRAKISRSFTPQAEEAAPEPQGSGAPDVTQVTPTTATTPSSAAEQVRGETSTSALDDQTVVTPPKEALELKEKVIDALQAAFRAGKVQKVRSVLTQYGNGAKSFREIDIAQFPEIDEALQHGALN